MKVLIVDGFRRHEHGRKAWKNFESAVRQAIGGTHSAAHEVEPPDIACCTLAEVEERYCCDVALFDGAYNRAEAGRRFDACDLVFADGDDAALLPWAPRCRPLLALVLAFGLMVLHVFAESHDGVFKLKATKEDPDLSFHPDHSWHLFLSHIWSTGQDQMRVIKQRLVEMLPEILVFLECAK